jgi:hypothetical protein
MSQKQQQLNRQQLQQEQKRQRAERLETKLETLDERLSYEKIVANLEKSRQKDKERGISHLPVSVQIVMGKDGEVVRYARQARKNAALALEYAKNGDAQSAGYFATYAHHILNNALRLFVVGGWTKEKSWQWQQTDIFPYWETLRSK